MIGVCTGNVRSTPTPKLILRTVNVSRSPLPCRRMTTPWNTCTRDREPSTTRTCTRRVSPGRKSGTSSRRESASRPSRVFITCHFLQVRRTCGTRRHERRYWGWRAPARRPEAAVCREDNLLMVPQPPEYPITGTLASDSTYSEQIRPTRSGAPLGLVGPPRGDRGMMTGKQHGGHVEATPPGGLRVDRRFEQPVRSGGERVIVDRVGIAHDAGYQPSYRLDDY